MQQQFRLWDPQRKTLWPVIGLQWDPQTGAISQVTTNNPETGQGLHYTTTENIVLESNVTADLFENDFVQASGLKQILRLQLDVQAAVWNLVNQQGQIVEANLTEKELQKLTKVGNQHQGILVKQTPPIHSKADLVQLADQDLNAAIAAALAFEKAHSSDGQVHAFAHFISKQDAAEKLDRMSHLEALIYLDQLDPGDDHPYYFVVGDGSDQFLVIPTAAQVKQAVEQLPE
ncbi:hypothetical protein [Lactobacillus selangorensis]|nr:hypothetical protein [Lactobacillus selangorensis]